MKGISPDRPAFDFFQDSILRPAGVGGATINERTFILEARMNNQSRDMTFRVIQNTKDSDREIKLDLEDIALITHIRMSLQKVKEMNGYIIPLTPDLTFADKDYFVGVKDGHKEVDAVNAVFDGGKLSIESKSSKRLTDFDTFGLQYIPYTKTAGLPALGMNSCERGFHPLVNPIILSGKSENDIKLKLGYMISEIMEGKWDAAGAVIAADAAGKATEETPYNVVRLRLRGLVALNAATKYTAWLSANESK